MRGKVRPASILVAVAVAMLALWTEVALAASAPSLYTGGSSSLTPSSAVLGGGVNPHGQATSFYFQYGPSSAYGSQTASASAGAGTQVTGVTAAVIGLVANTSYHYRLVGSNATGVAFGQDHVLTTKKVPLTFKLSTPGRDVFGSPFTVAGTLSGTDSAQHQVILFANAFPFLAGFKAFGTPVLTDVGGSFSFNVSGLAQNTQLRVETRDTPPATSGVLAVRVAVRVALHVRASGRVGFVHLYGAIAPAQVLAPVRFQLLRPGLRPMTVGQTVAKRAGGAAVSRFDQVVRVSRGGLYRASVEVLSGAQVSNHSRPILIR